MTPITRPRSVLVAVSLTALVLSACTSADQEYSDTTETTTATDTTTATTTADAAPAAEVAPITASNCEFDEAPAGDDAGGEATGGESDRDITTNPEIATGYRSGMQAVQTQSFSVATANPVATRAACDVLLQGGTAADAVVTAQFVLGLTEPQSSGIGGGGYILYHDAATGENVAIDGREVAPLAADENYLIHVSPEDQSAPVPDARRSGRSIGVPGIVAECGGSLSCATCHVFVDESQLDQLPEMDEMEDEMLYGAAVDREDNSRLSCQIPITEGMDLKVTTPETQV